MAQGSKFTERDFPASMDPLEIEEFIQESFPPIPKKKVEQETNLISLDSSTSSKRDKDKGYFVSKIGV